MASPCHEFCCSDFAKKSPRPETDECNLDNPIHLIFARENFPGFTNRQYAQLKSTLQLASRFLTVDALAEYIITMTEGDMFVIGDDHEKIPGKVSFAQVDALDKLNCEGYPGTRLMRFPKPGQAVDHQLRSKAKRTLKAFANMVKFTTTRVEHPCTEAVTTISPEDAWEGCASTECVEGPLSEPMSSRYPRGVLSLITIPGHRLDEMNKYTKSRATDPHKHSWDYRRRMELDLASTLIHEIGHALQMAVQGMRCSECYYKDSPYCEAGYDLEARVFGGYFSKSWCCNPTTAHRNPLERRGQDNFAVDALMEWPIGAGALYDRYESLGGPMNGRWVQEKYEVIVRLDAEFVCRFFRNEFWTDVVPTYGSGPLRPKGSPRWILTTPKSNGPGPGLKNISHLDDPDLDGIGKWKLTHIIMRQEGFKAQEKLHDSSYVLESLHDLWSSS